MWSMLHKPSSVNVEFDDEDNEELLLKWLIDLMAGSSPVGWLTACWDPGSMLISGLHCLRLETEKHPKGTVVKMVAEADMSIGKH
jgi:hypothetical protein